MVMQIGNHDFLPGGWASGCSEELAKGVFMH